MAIRLVKGKPGEFYDDATDRTYTISDLRADDKYETVKLDWWWRFKQIVWMVVHPWQAIRTRIEHAYHYRLVQEMYEQRYCPVCDRRLRGKNG